MLYEQNYRDFEDVADELEWDPYLQAVRHVLEREFEAVLRSRLPRIPEPGDIAEDFFEFVAGHDGPSIAAHVQRAATPGASTPTSSSADWRTAAWTHATGHTSTRHR